jgi:membrane-bound lytic murein transglycosylase C
LQRHATFFFILFFISTLSQATDSDSFLQSQSAFDTYKSKEDGEFQSAKDEFKLYKQKIIAAFDQYKFQVSRVWGDKDTISPNSKNWISFQGDLGHRSIVDFEKGTIDVEIALPAGQNISEKDIRDQLQNSIINTLEQGRDNRSVIDIAKNPVSLSVGPAVLNGQVADQNDQPIDQQDYSKLAAQASSNIRKKQIKGNDGKARVIYKTQLKLVSNHIEKRAIKYKADVELNAEQQKIPAALVFAIMETESMFNPTARSPAPAFGLMQLVPTSGARDAYRQLYNKDRIVSDTYLYKPNNNIKLGTAYLNRLHYVYLKGIKNPQSRQWASIAAYNTGAGNVFRAFAGKYRKSRFGSRKKWKQAALYEINKMTSEQVYSHLRKRLTFKEARHYVKKVRSRINKYKAT